MNIPGRYFGFDLETKDPDLKTLGPGWAFPDRGGFIAGFALSWFDGDPDNLTLEDLKNPELVDRFGSKYLAVRHEAGGNMPYDKAKSMVQPLLADSRRSAVMANCLYDYGWALAEGFEWKCGIEDVQIQAPLLDDQRLSYGLDVLGKHYLNQGKDESSLRAAAAARGIKNIKAELWRMHGDEVAPYGEQDAVLTLWLFFYLRILIREKELERVHELENSLVPLLYRMRKKGVAVDLGRADELRSKYLLKEQEAQKQLELLTSHPIDPWASNSVIIALEAEGVSNFPLTPKKKEKSVDNVFLKSLAAFDNPAGRIAEQVLILRRYNKARGTFIENMLQGHTVNGRIHCELKQLRSDEGGTVSGRFSCAMPNLQQVPGRDPELGPEIRSCFIPDEGMWTSIDYSSQEPRLAAHFGVKANVRGADYIAQKFRDNPREDPYLPTAELCGISRKDAKTIKLGILYGMGGGKLCMDLGLEAFETSFTKGGKTITYMKAGPEGQALIDKFDENSPMDRELSNLAQRTATKRGYVKTILGRRATFPRQTNGEVWFTHKALNRIIQGSAADMTKQAMLDCDAAGFPPLLSVHDELCFDLPDRETAEGVAQIMADAIPLEVPVVCDVEMGRNWGESMGK